MTIRIWLFAILLSFAHTAVFAQATDKPATSDTIPTIDIQGYDSNTDDDDFSFGQNSGGINALADGPFLYYSFITFGKYNFRPRAFNNYELQINGIRLENYERGFPTFGQTGGINNVLYNANRTYGLNPSAYGFGGYIGIKHIDATAADQRKGTNISYTYNERYYGNRIAITHNSGLMKNGWAYSLSASRRWAQQNYRPGTFYDGYSFYGAVSKVIRRSQFNLTAFAAPTVRGGSAIAIDETYHLANNNMYNPEWGYQNGKVRNSRVYNVFQPLIIANYTYKPSDRTRWNTAVGYEFGKYKRSGLDGYNAANPYGDYYRNLPSYYDNFNPALPTLASAVRAQLQSNPGQLQVNWDNLYSQNYTNTETLANIDGIQGNNFTGHRSLYILSDQVDDMKKTSFNTNIEHSVNEHLNVYGGARLASQTDQFYKQVTDLLGGDYFVNYNQFANQQNPGNFAASQNDLNHPDQLIKNGDIYGYNVKTNIIDGGVWGQAVFNYNKFNFFGSARVGYNSFYRDGLMKNGLFPNNSYGVSPAQNFTTYGAKAGVTYKLGLKDFLYFNAAYGADAPLLANTYVSVRTRDYTIDGPTTQKSRGIEGGYILKTSKLSGRISGYLNDFSDVAIIRRFYNDDPSIQSFVNYVMKGVGIRSMGAEFTGEYKVSEAWSLIGFASEGSTFYTNSPLVSVYQDNIPGITSVAHRVYIKNYYYATGPQSVYSLAVNYKSARRWQGNISFNYMDRNYVSINPDRRTQLALDLVQPGSTQWNSILGQEKLPSAFTIDLHGGKTFNVERYFKSLDHRTTLAISFGVVNALNDKNIKVYGQEQLRYDYTYRNINKFPNKYDYAYGINFYANISLRF